MRLRRAVQRVAQNLAGIAGKHIREDGSAFDDTGVAEARAFAGELLAIEQDDVASSLLQMQGRANADHACTQYENVGLEFRHPALRKFNV